MATNRCQIILSENNSELWCITQLTVNIYCSYAFHYIKFCIYYKLFVLRDEEKTLHSCYNCKTWVYILLVSYACSMADRYDSFGGTCSIYFRGCLEDARSRLLWHNTMVPFYHTAWHHWESQTYCVVGFLDSIHKSEQSKYCKLG